MARWLMPRRSCARCEPEDLAVAGIVDDEAGLIVEHAQALRHVSERRVETPVLIHEGDLRGAQFRQGARERRLRSVLGTECGAAAAVAAEASVLREHRFAADPQPERPPVGMIVGIDEIAERLLAIQGRAVGLPEGGIVAVRGEVDSGQSRQRRDAATEHRLDVARKIGEDLGGIRFPDPIRIDRRQIAQDLCSHAFTKDNLLVLPDID